WSTWQVVGTDIAPGSHALGPHAVGSETDLFYIPFDTGAPLVGLEEWQDGQFHAFVPTASKNHGLYLIRIEVFDGAGNRLEPATAGFTYRRWGNPPTPGPGAPAGPSPPNHPHNPARAATTTRTP